MRARFDGWIAGIGTASGLRCVVGHWPTSPLGPFTDVMVERVDGARVLFAPSPAVAEFVSSTYLFDEVRTTPVEVSGTPFGVGCSPFGVGRAPVREASSRWTLDAGPLTLTMQVGRRPALGYLLRAVPRPLATSPRWISGCDQFARRFLTGVRTVGSAGSRREYYGALDLHRIASATVRWEGVDQGALADVDPPVRFGFSSTPSTPSLIRVVTLIDD